MDQKHSPSEKDQIGRGKPFNKNILSNRTPINKTSPDAKFEYKHFCSSIFKSYDFFYTGSNGENATFDWSFEDAIILKSNLKNPKNIIFNSYGYKTVSLKVTVNEKSETVSQTILIENTYNSEMKNEDISQK